jgi:hypothetical protein
MPCFSSCSFGPRPERIKIGGLQYAPAVTMISFVAWYSTFVPAFEIVATLVALSSPESLDMIILSTVTSVLIVMLSRRYVLVMKSAAVERIPPCTVRGTSPHP